MVSLIAVNRASDKKLRRNLWERDGRSWSNVTVICSFFTAPFKPCCWYGKNTKLALNKGFPESSKRLALYTKNSSIPSSIRSDMSTSSSNFLLTVRGSSFRGFRSTFSLSRFFFILLVLTAPPCWLSSLACLGTLSEWSNSNHNSSASRKRLEKQKLISSITTNSELTDTYLLLLSVQHLNLEWTFFMWRLQLSNRPNDFSQ